jgi:hypothetical protein
MVLDWEPGSTIVKAYVGLYSGGFPSASSLRLIGSTNEAGYVGDLDDSNGASPASPYSNVLNMVATISAQAFTASALTATIAQMKLEYRF